MFLRKQTNALRATPLFAPYYVRYVNLTISNLGSPGLTSSLGGGCPPTEAVLSSGQPVQDRNRLSSLYSVQLTLYSVQ